MLKQVKLTGEQKNILFLPFDAPIQIKGVAGSGKTTVAIYRAKQYLETKGTLFDKPKVGIFTFNKNLVRYIQSLCRSVRATEKDSSAGINAETTNFHSWVYQNILKNRFQLDVLKEREKTNIISSILNELKSAHSSNILNTRVQFFVDEISWIKGKIIEDWDTYSVIPRTGRGTKDRVTSDDRKYIWKVYIRYKERLSNISKHDFDDFALIALRELERQNYPKYYDHLVIDEAQDLNKAQMLVLSSLVPDSKKSITVIADSAQRIYKSGFNWKEVGLSVAGGRTHELSKNYRNNVHIARAAKSLLDHEEDQSEFTKIKTARKGDIKPELIYCIDSDVHLKMIVNKVEKIKREFQNDNVVILHRNYTGLEEIELELSTNDIDYIRFRKVRDYNFSTPKVITCTMSSIKGLEFDHVLIAGLNKDTIPDPKRYSDEKDELHESTERRLLYTAMTRAQVQLYLFCIEGHETRFIDELNHKHFDVIGNRQSNTSVELDDDLPF
mgnify:CR=1 FL=1